MSTPHESTPPAAATAPAGVQEIPPGPPAVKLPPQPRPDVTPEEQARGAARLDGALVALVLVLAFLCGSFAVRNSDFWMHLATGRAIAQRAYLPWSGQDPFAYTTAGTYWTNHNWLYDLGLYAAHLLLGDTALVVLKALLVVALAVVLLQTRRPGQSLWVPAACTGLAILAISPRLYFQPVVFSYLFLALTLWYLESTRREPAAGDNGGRRVGLWWLPVLFILWANTDGWFLVGLLAVALYLIGEVLQTVLPPAREEGAAAAGRVRRLGAVLVLCAAACLLNPNLYHVYLDWPAELSFTHPVSLLARDNEFRSFFLSPFDPLYLGNSALGYSVAGLAFLPLALVGIISFAVNRRGWRWSRALTWLAFFALAAWRLPAVPFFAVVAGPIAVLNFQDAAALRRREEAEPIRASLGWGAIVRAAVLAVLLVTAIKLITLPEFWVRLKAPDYPTQFAVPAVPLPFLVFAVVVLGLFFYALGAVLPVFDRVFTNWPLGGRLLTALAGVALLVMAWPGWLHASWFDPYRARHVAWAVEPDESYQQVAQFLVGLRGEGKLRGDDHGFALPPQVANYLAWYCPEEKGFFDPRFTLFPGTAQDFLGLRDALRVPEKKDPNDTTARVWPANEEAGRRVREAFRKDHITYVILGERDVRREVLRIEPLLNDSQEWVLLYRDGRTAVFGWQDPEAKAPAAASWEPLRWDAQRLAFGAVPDTERAPEQGPPPGKLFAALSRYMEGAAPESLKLAQTEFDLDLFSGMRDLYQQRNLTTLGFACAAGLVGAADPAGGHVAAPGLLGFQVCAGGPLLPRPPRPEGKGTEIPEPPAPPSQAANWVAEQMARSFVYGNDSGPPAYALLAVRAARAAVAQTPRDPRVYLALEQAYYTLHVWTRERSWSHNLRALDFLRHVQTVNALSRALELDPDLSQAHAEMVQRYLSFRQYNQLGFLDAALRHAREQLRLQKGAGRLPQQTEKDYKHDVEVLEKFVKDLQQQVNDKQNQYEVRSAKLPVLQKAQLALGLGLADQALSVLLESEVLLFGQEGARLELELLLCLGRGRDVRRILFDPSVDMTKDLGLAPIGPYTQVPAFEWYGLVLAAAEGDYKQVDAGFDALRKATGQRLEPEGQARLARTVLANLMNTPQSLTFLTRIQAEEMRMSAMQELGTTAMAVQEQAELLVYQGMFALEAGDTGHAGDCFRRAMALGEPPGRFLPYLSLLGAASPLGAAALTGPSAFAADYPATDFPGREVVVHYLNVMDAAAAPRR